MSWRIPGLAATVALILGVGAAIAAPGQRSLPQPEPLPPPIVAPRDVAYPGTLRLQVDATDLERRIFRVRQSIPLAGTGPVTLLYPQWLPGRHRPFAQVEHLTGLTITSEGRRIPWRRDAVEIAAFHVDPPPGARSLELEFQFVSALASGQGRMVMTPAMMNVQWNSVALYPAGWFTRRIPIEASIRLPAGWGYGVALDTASNRDNLVTFKPVSFETLVDSPMFAGRWFKRVDLDPGGRSPVVLNMVADEPASLEMTPEQLQAHRNLVVQADRLFGARHFDRYDFLLALTSELGGIGLEHHRSSENSVSPGYFTAWDRTAPERDLLPHEYVHSWNGKYRRPAELWTPTFNTPMRGSLLWVYEGQTQYWGYVLAARSGLISRQDALDALAMTAAAYQNRIGRTWRPLADTTLDPVIANRRPLPWVSWQRSEDYYSEGQLIWLEVDTLLREKSGGQTSLDDFARAFFGMNDGDWGVLTYRDDDVVQTLNQLLPMDWAGYLRARVEEVAVRPPLEGLERGGWRLVYSETPTAFFSADEADRRITDLTYSLGLVVNRDGDLTSVMWDGPAFRAGLATGNRLVAINGRAWSADLLRTAVTEAKTTGKVDLLLRSGDRFRTVSIPWAGGLRYPRLERVAGTPDRLGEIFAPRP
ncbi:MAG: peptidase M61 [Phenylobacterium sp.]|jgi:predicted metalloprotease with PDZ domain|nr:peptidase M61 [Phenylobacterium sp.]